MSTISATTLAFSRTNLRTAATLTTATLTVSDPRFGGYTIGSDGFAVQNFCPTSMVYTTQSTLAGCCSSINGTGACDLTQGCRGSSTIYGVGYVAVCNSGLVCNTDTVYDQFPNTTGTSRLAIYCGGAGATVNYYRQVVTTTPTIVTLTDTTSAATSTSVDNSTTAPASSASSASSTSAPSESQSGDGSKAWIAGAVVGPVVGVPLLALALWWLLRRRTRYGTTVAKSYPMSEPMKEHKSNGPTMMPM